MQLARIRESLAGNSTIHWTDGTCTTIALHRRAIILYETLYDTELPFVSVLIGGFRFWRWPGSASEGFMAAIFPPPRGCNSCSPSFGGSVGAWGIVAPSGCPSHLVAVEDLSGFMVSLRGSYMRKLLDNLITTCWCNRFRKRGARCSSAPLARVKAFLSLPMICSV